MPSCVFRKCTNCQTKINKVHGITYHRFPSDELLRLNWIDIVREQRSEHDWMPTVYSRICSDHFNAEHKYTSPKGRILLKSTAVPIFKKHENLPLRCDTPNSLEEVDISNMASVFDTPKTFALEKRICRLVMEKEKIQKKNKVLKQHNRRLLKKIYTMRSILKIIKNKNYISEQQFMELNLKPEVIGLLNRIHNKEKSKKSFRKKYSPSLRTFALTLNSYSPAAYKYVRHVFHTALPHPRVLEKWCENTSISKENDLSDKKEIN